MGGNGRPRRYPAHSDCSLHVDRRLRARPHGGAGAQTALAESTGGYAGDNALRAAGRLYARSARWRGLGPAPQPAGADATVGSRPAIARAGVRNGSSCHAPGNRPLRPRWPASRNGWDLSAKRDFGLLNRWRWGERALPRMIDRKASLALPAGAERPPEWPAPQLRVSGEDVTRWRQAQGLGTGPAVALAPGAVGSSKRWTSYAEAARMLAERGIDLWVVGGPNEKAMADRNRGNRRPACPGSDGSRPAKRHSGDGGGHHRDFERLRPAARRGRDRNADNGNFRTDQSLSLGAFERARGNDTGKNVHPVPTVPPPGLHHERPSLHERYPGSRGGCDCGTGACGGWRPRIALMRLHLRGHDALITTDHRAG